MQRNELTRAEREQTATRQKEKKEAPRGSVKKES